MFLQFVFLEGLVLKITLNALKGVMLIVITPHGVSLLQ